MTLRQNLFKADQSLDGARQFSFPVHLKFIPQPVTFFTSVVAREYAMGLLLAYINTAVGIRVNAALRDTDAASAIDRHWPKSFYRRGRALEELGDWVAASAAYQKVPCFANESPWNLQYGSQCAEFCVGCRAKWHSWRQRVS
jgi:hypothetical protein